MLSKAVAIRCNHCSNFIEIKPFVLSLALNACTMNVVVYKIKRLVIFRWDIRDFRPLSLLLFEISLTILVLNLFFIYQNGSNSESVGGSGHQISDYALVSLAFVNLPELLCIVDFHSYAILENILDLLFVLGTLELLRVTPWYLNGCWSLCNMSELSLAKRVLLKHLQIFILKLRYIGVGILIGRESLVLLKLLRSLM